MLILCWQEISTSFNTLTILTNKKELFKNSDVLEVGISVHQSVIVTALKSQLIKGNTKIKFHQYYSYFQMGNYNAELDYNLKSNTSFEYSQFQSTLNRALH